MYMNPEIPAKIFEFETFMFFIHTVQCKAELWKPCLGCVEVGSTYNLKKKMGTGGPSPGLPVHLDYYEENMKRKKMKKS